MEKTYMLLSALTLIFCWISIFYGLSKVIRNWSEFERTKKGKILFFCGAIGLIFLQISKYFSNMVS